MIPTTEIMMIRKNSTIRSSQAIKDFLGVVVDCKIMPRKTFHYHFKTLITSYSI